MYAVLKSVGKQFKVSPGDILKNPANFRQLPPTFTYIG